MDIGSRCRFYLSLSFFLIKSFYLFAFKRLFLQSRKEDNKTQFSSLSLLSFL